MANDDDDLRAKVAHLLTQDGWWIVRDELKSYGAAAVPILIDEIRQGHPQPKFTERAILALGEIGGIEAEAFLTSLLDHQDAMMRAAAVTALRQIGGAQHIPAITPLLNDTDDSIRKEAIRYLAAFGDAASIEMLEAVSQGEAKPFLKQEAETAIAQIKERLAK